MRENLNPSFLRFFQIQSKYRRSYTIKVMSENQSVFGDSSDLIENRRLNQQLWIMKI